MTNLFLYKLKNQFKVLLPLMGVSLILAVFWYLSGLSDNRVLQILCKILSMAALFAACLPAIATVILSWMDFYNTFFGRRAYLIRTLPFSRSSLYGCSLLSDLVCILIGIAWPVLFLFCILNIADDMSLMSTIPAELLSPLFKTLIALFMQCLFIEQSGFTGGLLGFRMSQNKLPWSVGFGNLTYVAGNLVMTPAIFIYMGGDLSSSIVPLDVYSGLMTLIVIVYAVVNLALLILDGVLVRGRTDVD